MRTFEMNLRRVAASVALFCTIALPVYAEDAPILIGLSVPDTGAAATPAMWQRWGVDLAADEINAGGGLLGRKVQILALDNRCNPSEAVNVANKLVEAKVAAIIGAHCSSATIASMPIIAAAKIPMVEGVASSPRIAEMSGPGRNEWTFRINPSDSDMMKALTLYLKDNTKMRNIAVLGEDTDFGRGGAAAFAEFAKVDGLTVVSTDFHQQSQPDFSPLLTRLQQRRPDAIALFNLTNDQLNLFRNALQLGVHIPYTGRFDPGGANGPIIQAGGLEGSVTAWTYSGDIDTPENKAFVAKMQELHKAPTTLQAWAGYDEMRLLGVAIKAAGSADPEKIRDSLRTVAFTNIMGQPVKFDEQNQGGRIVVIEEISGRKAKVMKIINLQQ
jgi:branched-chain amino acid transport system substrate-binding protein